MYAFVRDSSVHGEPCYAITYAAFYPYNGPYHVGSLCCRVLAGGHEADVEHVTLLISRADEELRALWFNAHHASQGLLVPASELETMEFADGCHATVVYVAENGHGHYSSPGTTHRVSCLANDHTQRGELWRPTPVVLPEAWDDEALRRTGTSWLRYGGTLGTAHSVSDWHHCSHEEQREPSWRVHEVGSVPCGIATKAWWVQDQNRWESTSWFHRMFCLCWSYK